MNFSVFVLWLAFPNSLNFNAIFIRIFCVSQIHSHVSKTFYHYFPIFKYSNSNICCSTEWVRASNKCYIIVMLIAMAPLFLILKEIALFYPYRLEYWLLLVFGKVCISHLSCLTLMSLRFLSLQWLMSFIKFIRFSASIYIIIWY